MQDTAEIPSGAAIFSALSGLANWLDIHPSLQDFVKAGMLTVFVLIILMILGDVYRGEIQNRLHRVRLVYNPKSMPPLREPTDLPKIRRRAGRERDIAMHLTTRVVDAPLNRIYSDAIFFIRYHDFKGKLRHKRLETYRVNFRVRGIALPNAWPTARDLPNSYTEDEAEDYINEHGEERVALAQSRVDYLEYGKLQPFEEKLQEKFKKLSGSRALRFLSGMNEKVLRKPEFVGLVVKFHFPINPHFLLYKHPDTNVRSTAWLTVMTSVFALFMQLVYVGHETTPSKTSKSRLETITAPERPVSPPVKSATIAVTPTSATLHRRDEETVSLRP